MEGRTAQDDEEQKDEILISKELTTIKLVLTSTTMGGRGTSWRRNNDQPGRWYTRAERGYFEARVGTGTMIRLDVVTPGRRGDILRHESVQEQ
ncbi:hypothetical protein RRG08_030049 [Elysia crispata]|uniref:Uncharacterized protein n=1 Tax=Elysia crispata TaxID=231223 RepID=A0AAE0XZC6_9GAST|nr:hypothetical protein RRG08_030049 [Elysia crispata]